MIRLIGILNAKCVNNRGFEHTHTHTQCALLSLSTEQDISWKDSFEVVHEYYIS